MTNHQWKVGDTVYGAGFRHGSPEIESAVIIEVVAPNALYLDRPFRQTNWDRWIDHSYGSRTPREALEKLRARLLETRQEVAEALEQVDRELATVDAVMP